MIAEYNIKKLFQIFYNKIDKVLKTKKLEKQGTVRDQCEFIQKKQRSYDVNKLVDLDDKKPLDKKDLERLDKLQSRICYKNMIYFYKNKMDDNELRDLSKIVEHRDYLPEICHFALKMQFTDEASKSILNKTIGDLIKSNFKIKMFSAI